MRAGARVRGQTVGLQGVEVLTTMEQIKRVPDLGAGIFDIPAGFQDVTKHEGSTK